MESTTERLDLAKAALVETGYFTDDQVGDDIAPRIAELWSAIRFGLPRALFLAIGPGRLEGYEWDEDYERIFTEVARDVLEALNEGGGG